MQIVPPLRREYGWLRGSFLTLTCTAIGAAALEGVGLVVLVPLLESLVDGESTVDRALGPIRLTGSVSVLALVSAVALIAGATLQITGAWQRGRMTARWHHETQLELLDAYVAADREAQEAEPEGRMVALASKHVGEGSNGVRQLGFALRGLGGVLAFVVGALLIDVLGTLAVVGVGVLLFATVRPLVVRSKDAAIRLSAMNLAVAEELAQQIEMAADLRVHGVAEPAARRFRDLASEHRRLRVEAMVLVGSGPIIFRTLGILLLVGAIAAATGVTGAPVVRIGVVAILLYRSLSYGQLIQSSWQQLSEVVPYLHDLREAIDRLSIAARPDGSVDLPAVSTIACTDVSYHHPGSPTPTVENIDLKVERGEVLAIVGQSGAGKTTLADLLLGLRTPSRGSVTVDDTAVSDLAPTSRARLIARVAQDVPVWAATVAENVRMHRTDIADVAVERSLRAVGLDELIDASTLGLDTPLGNGERRLSGGQRQRLGVARAIVGEPDVLVLDEPTSALDAHNEGVVAELIRTACRGAAVVVVAHRPETIAAADRVIELRSGRIHDPAATTIVLSA